MSWLATLYETYEKGMQLDLPGEKLMPISHTLQNAHINVVIDGDGNFKRASVLEKTQVVLPATEKSAGRSSGEAPHALADKLHYIAKDYSDYGGKKKRYFEGYQKQLASWCNSENGHKKAIAVFSYISKGKVIEDLVNASVLHVNEDSVLLNKWMDKEQEPPLIFKVMPKSKGEIEQGDALVCWSVEIDGEPNNSTWLDDSLQQSWINFDNETVSDKDFCYVTGALEPIAANHPSKLRHTGDKAKLISANDSSGFTFRGRFTDRGGSQAVGVGFEVTQKAHNALRWLIKRQGFRNSDQVFVTWAVSGRTPPEPLLSTYELFSSEPRLQEGDIHVQAEVESVTDHAADFGESFAQRLKKYLSGYKAILDPNEQIVIVGLDSATPGRMGIIYYRQLLASEFLERIESWHNQFSWYQRYTKETLASNNGKKKKKTIWPISSPPPRTIAEAAYGDTLKSNENLKKSIIERIIPCIIDGRPFPRDIMVSAIRRAANRNNSEPWEWQRNLGVACALYKGYYLRHPKKNERREYSMALEESRTTRDYLYGRLLAIAERIEETALRMADENRPTNAARLMQRFADRPFSTWRTIELGLQPYIQRLQSNKWAGFLVNRKKEMDDVYGLFRTEDFSIDKPLTGEFLLGYHCQKQVWFNKDIEQDKEKGE